MCSSDLTFGGDSPECYELVLREAATRFDWSEHANKCLVLIGDSEPHEPSKNPGRIDWRTEAEELRKRGIRVYAVQALNRAHAEYFYRDLALLTHGVHLKLDQLSQIVDFLMAICYSEGDLCEVSSHLLILFEAEVTREGRMGPELQEVFNRLRSLPPPSKFEE